MGDGYVVPHPIPTSKNSYPSPAGMIFGSPFLYLTCIMYIYTRPIFFKNKIKNIKKIILRKK